MIINGQRYETEPAVEAYVKELVRELDIAKLGVSAGNRIAHALVEEKKQLEAEIAKLDEAYYNASLAITRLRTENAQLEEKYQKATGVITTDSLPTRAELYKIKLMCLNHTVCETCEYIGDFGQCGLKGLPEDWSFGGADNEHKRI